MMSFQLVLVNTTDRILNVTLKDIIGSLNSPLSSQLNTDLRVIPLVTKVYDLAAADLC